MTATSTTIQQEARPDGGATTPGTRERRLAARRLGEVLLERGCVRMAQLDEALAVQTGRGDPLGRLLVDLGFLDGCDLVAALGDQHHLEHLAVGPWRLDPRALERVPRAVARRHRVLPLLEIDGALLLGVEAGPGPDPVADLLARQTGCRIEVLPIAPDQPLEQLVDDAYAALQQRLAGQARIGEHLVACGHLEASDVEAVLAEQRESDLRFGEVLEVRGDMPSAVFHELLAEQLGLPLVGLKEIRRVLDREVGTVVPRSFAEHNLVLPLSASGETLWVLTAGRLGREIEDLLCTRAQRARCRLLLATPADVRMAIREVHEPHRAGEEAPTHATFDLSAPVEDVEDLKDVEFSPHEDVEIPRIVNYLLFKALERRASDVHLERYEKKVVIRFRVDGVMHEIDDLPIGHDNVHRVITKLKLDAKLDIAERRRPQDGVIRKRFASRRNVDFRLAFQPTIHGENVVIRLLDRTKPLPPLEEIGFPEPVLATYKRLLENPQGMILFTGPTGSGKTTSLYATLDRLRKRPIKIITAEDPVEYNFEGIQQCQVAESLGNTFARYLRGFLRQDPDVILIGEMRDAETAGIGVQAAITGHLLFSTLHTNDAVSTVSRLLLLGIDPDMLATALLCVVSQRLVRRVCPDCREAYEPEARLRQELYPHGVPAETTFLRGRGCPACERTGFQGRLPLFEFWAPTAEVKSRIRQGVDDAELADLAFRSGMAGILDDGLRRVADGSTTVEELRRVIPYSQIAWYQEMAARHADDARV